MFFIMKKVFLSIIIFYCLQANAQNKIVLHTAKVKDTISKNIYGHFAEHLGHGIYGGFYVGITKKKVPIKTEVGFVVLEPLKK